MLSRVQTEQAEEALIEGDRIIDSSLGYLSLEELLGEILERVRTLLDADTAAILMLDPERNVLLARAARGLTEEVREGVQIPIGKGFAGRIAAERKPIFIEDINDSFVLNPLLRHRGIRSLLGVPLQIGDEVLGVLHVGTLHPRVFDEGDTRLLQLAADRAVNAIHRAQLSEQRSFTEVLQRTLLPEALPEVPGIRLSAKYIPAGLGIKVGGDWYDVFAVSPDRIGLVIGDVVGRGVLAASVVAELRAALRAYAIEHSDLTRIMGLLNRLALAMGRNRSATVSLLTLDQATQTLSGVSAGHLPALLRRADGSQEFVVGASGLPLGNSQPKPFVLESHPFAAGSVLVLCTDGLIERRHEPIDRGLARLADSLERALEGNHLPLADRIYRDLAAHGSFEDDVALLVIESLAEASVK
jgi:serine phosphatase RsbU (regulator of sigma subunit)